MHEVKFNSEHIRWEIPPCPPSQRRRCHCNFKIEKLLATLTSKSALSKLNSRNRNCLLKQSWKEELEKNLKVSLLILLMYFCLFRCSHRLFQKSWTKEKRGQWTSHKTDLDSSRELRRKCSNEHTHSIDCATENVFDSISQLNSSIIEKRSNIVLGREDKWYHYSIVQPESKRWANTIFEKCSIFDENKETSL